MLRWLFASACAAFSLLYSPVGLPSAVVAQEAVFSQLDNSNPWYPDKDFPKLVTPQWVGEEGVECVVVLAIDDMRETAKYEQYLRPILNRLKQIDGRAPVSIMTCDATPEDAQLQSWLEEGLSIDVHTVDHPCPLLQSGDFEKAKSTYDRCIDLLHKIPGNKPVAFRTPCCDSLNTVSPRFYSEIFSKTTPEGNFLQIDSSVMNFFTSADESIPRELILEDDGTERFWKYKVKGLKRGETIHNNFVNYITNYPYPYVINNSCWQFPCATPSDWSAQHLHGVNNPKTVEDWKAYLDICVLKQGAFSLVFHPHGWITAEQVNELIDHAVQKHGKKVKFLNFREVADRLNTAFGKTTLRTAPPDVVDQATQQAYRSAYRAATDVRSLAQPVRKLIAAGKLKDGLPLRREDGSHNGVFVRDNHICWMNEDTAQRADLILQVPVDKVLAAAEREEARRNQPPVRLGAAVVDITPEHPVRLTGYGNRMTESDGVAVRIHARALAIGGASAEDATEGAAEAIESPGVDFSQPLAVMITVDNCGVPASVTQKVFEKVASRHNIPRERFAISSTHTHSGPWLRDFAPNIFADIPDDHALHLQQYEERLIEQLVAVVDNAIATRRAAHLSLGFGELGFAINRRVLNEGQWKGFGEVPDGPTDKRFPMLAAHDVNGRLIAILANYACHATTETGAFNQISGDWPGFAADMIEADLQKAGHEGAVALIAIGCGADANPSPRGTHEQAQMHGRAVADEVRRLLNTQLSKIHPGIQCRMAQVDLPLGPVPSREELQQTAQLAGVDGSRAQYFLKLLDDGQSIPTTVPDYPVQTWCFGEDLAMVFLGGEVVVDYAMRLSDMFDSDRLWINAYSNDVPCYIASKRILREGGYEADSSMRYYRRPTRLAPEAEDIICDAVQKLLPHAFYTAELQTTFPGPKSPDESLAKITVRPGFKAQLIAAEPLIRDPVAFDWDIQGRLWVVEMGGYPSGTTASAASSTAGTNGRIRVLEDTDGDGLYDQATTFLDGLNFPTGLHPWRNGMIITAAPDVIFAADTDGDLQADEQQILYSGFVPGNQQHRVNGPRWGRDGWLYLANGDSGGDVRTQHRLHAGSDAAAEAEAAGKAVNIRGRDLRIQPDTGALQTLSGQTQFGRNRDDFGNWFGNNNSNPIWHYVLEDRYLSRNPHATGIDTKAQVAEIPGAAPVFPTSQTLARFNDFGAANRFTSACSTSIYRDTLLGTEFYGNAFTCEPVHNLVSRLVMQRNGVSFQGRRAADEADSEFFASADNWTRPVMVRTGPDGAIYIADMYRQVIEHPEWIPAEYQRKLDLRAGWDKGRIYRIVPDSPPATVQAKHIPADPLRKDASSKDTSREVAAACCGASEEQPATVGATTTVSASRTPVVEAAWLKQATGEVSTAALIERLNSTNGWWRDTAQRLLQHQTLPMTDSQKAQLTEQLMPLATQHSHAAARAQALFVLAWLDTPAARSAIIQHGLQDDHADVRRSAVQAMESWLQQLPSTAEMPTELLALTNDPAPAVQQQLAFTLGAMSQPAAANALAEMLRNSADNQPHVTSAVMTSLNADNISIVLQSIAKQPDTPAERIWQLVAQAAAFQQTDAVVDTAMDLLTGLNPTAPAAAWSAAANAWPRLVSNATITAAIQTEDVKTSLTAAIASALQIAEDQQSPADQRTAAVKFLSTAQLSDPQQQQLTKLFHPSVPPEIQHAAIAVVARSPAAVDHILESWAGLTPALRSGLTSTLMQSTSGTERLLTAVHKHQVAPADIDAAARELLLNHRDERLRKAAAIAFHSSEPSPRSSVVEYYREQIAELQPDAAVGQLVFTKRCSACHRLQDIGKQIGADLNALKNRSTDALLTAILDPNQAVETKFLSYTAVTKAGRLFSGMLLNETSNSITLLSTDDKQHVIARTDLEEMTCNNRSLMPEGLEKDLAAQDLLNVIAFVQASGSQSKAFAGNEPRVIRPDADGSITLPATAAQIHGPSLVFEDKHGNLGWWTSTKDHAVWMLDSPRSGHWTVELNYACDSSAAGNLLKLSTGTRLLTARVPGTGTWDDYKTWTAGKIDLGSGRRQLIVTAPEKPATALIDLKSIRLIPPSDK